jgi:Carboxypeptidase regulatory-like domain
MASPRGTILPVSWVTFHSLMCLHLEAVLLRGEAARERDREHSRRLSPRAIRWRRLTGALVVLFGLLFMSNPRLTAQSTFGSIRGTAQDSSGAAIPDTQVTLHSLDQNTDRAVKTNATGDYAFENVLAGQYSIRAQRNGFAGTEVDGITLAARQDSRYNLTMTIATLATTVQVTSSANQIDTENGVIGDAKNTSDIGQLPLNFRASTTSPLASLETSPNVQTDSRGNIAIGGATSNMIGFSVDGISTTNVFNSAAGTNPYPSPEGIAELKVTAFNNNAEFSQVGDVTFTSKGGTNNFHGSLFEYLQNDVLDAHVFNFAEKAPKHFNTFGGSIGGPVLIPHFYNGHNKTFFFFDYEGNRRRTSQAEQYTVPTALERTGNLSELAATLPGGASGHPVLTDPSTGQAYPNLTIPNISPFATALLNRYYPLPNLPTSLGGVNYQTLVPIPSNTDGFDARIDQVITSKQQMYARFNRKNLTVNVVNPLLPNDVDTEHDRSFLVSHNYDISSRLLNEFRYGYTDTILSPNFGIEGAAALQGLGLQVGGNQGVNVSNHPTDQGFPSIVFSDGNRQRPRRPDPFHNQGDRRQHYVYAGQTHDSCRRGCSLGALRRPRDRDPVRRLRFIHLQSKRVHRKFLWRPSAWRSQHDLLCSDWAQG